MMIKISTFVLAVCLSATPGFSHDTGEPHDDAVVGTNQLPFVVETKGPIKAPPPLTEPARVSGQGFWKFVAVTNLVPVPEAALPFVKAAHGTLIVDAERDVVYWGLKKVGWVGFSNQLRDSWIVPGDPAFTHNNLHGADILPRKGQLPLVAAADNEGYKVYLTDTTFLHPQTLPVPDGGPYATNKTYRPTDVAFVSGKRLFVTDGYARGYFMPMTVDPFAYEGTFFGGHALSQTPHGITYDPKHKDLLVSARPEGQIKHWSVAEEKLLAIAGLPPGTLLCDVDLWGDYALAACLDGANKTPGPLMIVNLKKQTLVSVIKPKEELGYDFADHMHDAVWYVRKNGRQTEVYLLFTAWNPGGVGALRLVNVPD
jgi:hypothetical protein